MKITLYVQDIECDSCVTLIERSLKPLQGINGYQVRKDSIEIDFDPSLIRQEAIQSAIMQKGFRTSSAPLSRMSYKARLEDFKHSPHKYKVERSMLKISGISFLGLLLIQAAIYLALFIASPGFIGRYAQWLIYLDITIVSIAASLWHLKAYKGAVTSMTGMMLGMTVGMQGGFMIGAVLGATNGMFIGSMIGMLAGVSLGLYAGKDSGILGALQGMMSGLMGGTMGAMLTVMLLGDNVDLFMPVFMAINVLIMWGMSYMVYEEMVEDKPVQVKPADFATFFAYVFVAMVLLGLVMILGPKSLLIA